MLPQDTTPQEAPLKRCSKCGESKPATTEYFHRDKTMPGGLHPWCKGCRAKQVRANYEANSERIKQYNRDRYAANRDTINAYDRARYPARREQSLRYSRARYHANKEEYTTYKRHLRALRFGAEGTHTAADVRAQYERQQRKCYYCGVDVDMNIDYDVDHVIPLRRGGSNWPDNIVVTCASCNSSKRNRLVSEWLDDHLAKKRQP